MSQPAAAHALYSFEVTVLLTNAVTSAMREGISCDIAPELITAAGAAAAANDGRRLRVEHSLRRARQQLHKCRNQH
jgi:hypothetical protein